MIYGYLRVSTKTQRIDRQANGLKDICDKLYVERLSATAAKRPIFEQVLNELQSGDTLVVWDLDRAFRNAEDALAHRRRLCSRGIEFRAMNIEIDTQSADGKYNYTMAAAAAERERDKISERTIEGLVAARLRGSRLGRPPKMTNRQIVSAKQKIDAKEASVAELAALNGVQPWTLTRAIKRLIQSGHIISKAEQAG